MTAKTPTTSQAPTAEGLALWDAITSGAFAKAAKQQKKHSRRNKQPNAAHTSVMGELQHLLREAASTPWRPISVTLPVVVTTCSCGASYRTPSGDLLTTFKHKRNGSTHSIANHPSRFNPNLPRQIKEIHTTTTWCEHCFSLRPPATIETQGDLFSESHPPYSHPLAVPIDISVTAPVPYRDQHITPVVTVTNVPQKCKHCTIPVASKTPQK